MMRIFKLVGLLLALLSLGIAIYCVVTDRKVILLFYIAAILSTVAYKIYKYKGD